MNMLPGEQFGKKWKKWKKSIRRITRDLGQARDKDVEILFLQDMLKQTSDACFRKAVARMLLRSRQERKTLQSYVTKVIRVLKKHNIWEPLQERLKAVSSEWDKQPQDGLEMELHSMALNPISSRKTELLQFESCLEDPGDIRQHHQMRIAAKRLRYTMEICARLYGPRWKIKLNRMESLQTCLGEIRDCDVRLEKLDQFQREERRRTIEYFGDAKPFGELLPGMNYLREQLVMLRQSRFSSLVRMWNRLREQRFWEELISLDESSNSANFSVDPSQRLISSGSDKRNTG